MDIQGPHLVFVYESTNSKMCDRQRRRNRGGALGPHAPQDFAINKEIPFSFSENAPFFLRNKVPSKCHALKCEMLSSYVPGLEPMYTAF